MNMKKYTAFAVATVMAISCLGAFFAPVSSGEEITLNEGDTWGMGAYIDENTFIEMIVKAYEEQAADSTDTDDSSETTAGDPTTTGDPAKPLFTNKAELIDLIKEEFPDIEFDALDFSVYLGQYMFFEVASKDKNGYVINFAISTLVEVEVTLKGKATSVPGIEEGTFDIDDKLVIGIIMFGSVSTDTGMWVKKISVTTDVFATLKGKNEFSGSISKDAASSFADFNGEVDMGFSAGYDSITEFEADPTTGSLEGRSFKIFPDAGDEAEYQITKATSDIYSHLFVFGDFKMDYIMGSNTVDDSFSESLEFFGFGIDDDFFEDLFEGDFATSTACFLKRDYSSASGAPAMVSVEYELDDLGTPEEIEYDFNGMGIKTAFGGSDFELDLELDDEEKALFGNSLIYEDGFKLTGDNIGKVKDGVSKATRAYENGFYGKDVELRIPSEGPSVKTYGKPIGSYDGNAPEGKVFVGWNVAGEGKPIHMISEDFILKSDISARPVFAKEYTWDEFSADSFTVGDDGFVYVKVTDDDTITEIPKEILLAIKEKDGVLIIEGTDFKWILTGNDLGDDATLNPSVERAKWENEARFANKFAVKLEFSAKGKMPEDTKVSYDMSGDFSAGSMIDVFIEDDVDGTMEFVGSYRVAESGSVEFDVPHCSTYVLVQNSLPTEVAASGEEGGLPMTLIAVAVAAVIIAVVVVVYIRK